MTMPEWVNKNDTLKRLFDLIDVYSTMGIPPAVAYLKGGKPFYHFSSVIGQIFFSFQNNPKQLDPSYKMDLDLWHCLGRVTLFL